MNFLIGEGPNWVSSEIASTRISTAPANAAVSVGKASQVNFRASASKSGLFCRMRRDKGKSPASRATVALVRRFPYKEIKLFDIR